MSINSTDGIDTNTDALIRSDLAEHDQLERDPWDRARHSGNTGNFVLSNKVKTNGVGTTDNCVENSGNDAT